MELIKQNKQFIYKFIFPILGSVFLLSSIGKIYDIENFKIIVTKYKVNEFIAYLIIFLELLIAFFLSTAIFLKKTIIFTIYFLSFLTIMYIYGNYTYDIKSCECFGAINVLNPKSFNLALIKNIILILILILSKNIKGLNRVNLFFRFFSLIICLGVSFFIININYKFNQNYIYKFKNKNISSLGFKIEKKNDYNKVFIFSPYCIHCRKKIPLINTLSKNKSNNILGVISSVHDNSKTNKLIRDTLNINFKVISINSKSFNKVIKKVPLLLHVENDTIKSIEQ